MRNAARKRLLREPENNPVDQKRTNSATNSKATQANSPASYTARCQGRLRMISPWRAFWASYSGGIGSPLKQERRGTGFRLSSPLFVRVWPSLA